MTHPTIEIALFRRNVFWLTAVRQLYVLVTSVPMASSAVFCNDRTAVAVPDDGVLGEIKKKKKIERSSVWSFWGDSGRRVEHEDSTRRMLVVKAYHGTTF